MVAGEWSLYPLERNQAPGTNPNAGITFSLAFARTHVFSPLHRTGSIWKEILCMGTWPPVALYPRMGGVNAERGHYWEVPPQPPSSPTSFANWPKWPRCLFFSHTLRPGWKRPCVRGNLPTSPPPHLWQEFRVESRGPIGVLKSQWKNLLTSGRNIACND